MMSFQAYHVILVIFLSLTTTSIAYSNYAKPGCNDTCGNVRIPYPFGIGANCSVNEWYIVECNSSTPYLSALKHRLEVLRVDLENQTIAVNMQKFSKRSETRKVDLGESPFVLLESYNKVMDDDPMSLLWTLLDRDKGQVSCCDNYNPRGYRRRVDIGNGTSVDSWKCAYYEFYEGTPYLRDGCEDYPTVTEECARCEDSDGYCHYDTIYDVDGLVYSQNFTCGYYGDNNIDESRSRKTSMEVLIGFCICVGSLFLAAIIYASYKLMKSTRTRRRREDASKHTNGTLLIKQQEESNLSVADQISLFVSCEGEGHRLL